MSVAVVTGAAQGIGLAIAYRLAQDGLMVVMVDKSPELPKSVKMAQEWGLHVQGMTGDWADLEQARQVISASAQMGHLTALVNNAGTCRARPFLKATPEEWDVMASINLKAVMFATQAAAQQMIDDRVYGRIINIASISGRSGRSYQAAYAATKAGVISLTRSAALALAPHGITVNAVCPGVIDTPLTRRIHEQQAEALGLPPDQSLAQMVERVPLGRIGTGADVAGAVSFLVGPDAGYITGQALNVCGGLEMN